MGAQSRANSLPCPPITCCRGAASSPSPATPPNHPCRLRGGLTPLSLPLTSRQAQEDEQRLGNVEQGDAGQLQVLLGLEGIDGIRVARQLKRLVPKQLDGFVVEQAVRGLALPLIVLRGLQRSGAGQSKVRTMREADSTEHLGIGRAAGGEARRHPWADCSCFLRHPSGRAGKHNPGAPPASPVPSPACSSASSLDRDTR